MEQQRQKNETFLLPIDNRKRALYLVRRAGIMLIFLYYMLYICSSPAIWTGFWIIVSIIIILATLNYYRKRNIKQAFLKNEQFIINYKNKYITIPVKEVTEITSQIEVFHDLSGEMHVIYVITLKENYDFGDIIYLKYKYNKQNIDSEPDEISLIKDLMKKDFK